MTPVDPSPARARSFGLGAAAYRLARPGYPPDAIGWLVPDGATRVLDLAAGTGKLTEELVDLGVEVVAVEPDDVMRTELTAALPGVRALTGTAEAIPLADASVDCVTVAQAWHWFDADRATAEIARVLRPGGRLGVVWNVRDESVGWVEALTHILHEGDSAPPEYSEPHLGARFGPVEHATFTWTHRLPAAQLRTLAASRSHTIGLAPGERERLLDAVDALVHTHPDLAGRRELDVPYRTECWRATLR